jgi:hypothetical protein
MAQARAVAARCIKRLASNQGGAQLDAKTYSVFGVWR